MCLELILIGGIRIGRPPDLDLARLFADLTLLGSKTLVILYRICKNMIILPPQRKSLKASSFLYSMKCNLKYVQCSSGQNRQVITYVNLINIYCFMRGVDISLDVCGVAIFCCSLFPKILSSVLIHEKGRKKIN